MNNSEYIKAFGSAVVKDVPLISHITDALRHLNQAEQNEKYKTCLLILADKDLSAREKQDRISDLLNPKIKGKNNKIPSKNLDNYSASVVIGSLVFITSGIIASVLSKSSENNEIRLSDMAQTAPQNQKDNVSKNNNPYPEIINDALNLDHLRYFDIDDGLAKYIIDNKPAAIHLNGVKGMYVRGAQLLRMGSMTLKPNGFNILFLNGVQEISEDAAKELGQSHFTVIDMNGLKSISAEALKSLAGSKNPERILNLNGLANFPEENPKELYGMKLDTLSLNGIKKIDRSTLSKTRAMLVNTLKLNGLESFEPEDVQVLIEIFGHIPTIHLNGLKTITPMVAGMLRQLGVKDLYLDGLASLDGNIAFLLSQSITGNISLNGIKEIDEHVIAFLSDTRAKRVFLRGFVKFVSSDAYYKFYDIKNPPIIHSPKLKEVAPSLFSREWEDSIEE